jgi:hypothetical protein
MSDDAPAHGIPRPTIRYAAEAITLPTGQLLETAFQDAIAYVARLHGWKMAHFRPARTNGSWATAVSYDGKGFPDLVLVHPKRGIVIFVEVKSESGKVSSDQAEWLANLAAAGARTRTWYPADWPDIVPFLTDGRAVGLLAPP